MLRILGSAKTLCDSVTRREMLRVGGISAVSLGLTDLWKLQAVQAGQGTPTTAAALNPAGNFGRAKRIILLYLYGAAAQHETFDPKPKAPLEVRGIFRPIETAVPGVQICEHLPKIARIVDRVAIVRSMTHPYNIHSAAYTLTGVEKVDIPMELGPYDQRHWPFFGSVLDYLAVKQHPKAPPPEVPRSIGLPFQFSYRCPEFKRGGPYGGFLGRAFNPVWTEFEGEATKVIERWRGDVDVPVREPYLGITPQSRFTVSESARLLPEITLDRLERRRSLVAQFDERRRSLDSSMNRGPSGGNLDRFQQMAYSLITSRRLRDALDVSREPAELRERYGMTLFGQATLAGRRLLEAGATLVSVFWDEIQTGNSAWDTHFSHYERLKDELLPGLDSALSALILDLESRGMLDDTLVMVLTEHGRTPKISDTVRGAGREHWSSVYCSLLAGGGIARGTVVGSSDRNGGVRERPAGESQGCAFDDVSLDGGRSPHSNPRPFGSPAAAGRRRRDRRAALGVSHCCGGIPFWIDITDAMSKIRRHCVYHRGGIFPFRWSGAGWREKGAKATEAELAVLDLLWDASETEKTDRSAREITEILYPRGTPADVATVQKLLQRLEDKGLVRRDRSERVHRFSATVSRARFAGEQLSQMAEKLSGGSLAPLLVHLVESNRLSRRDLDELRSLLESRKRR